MHRDAPLPESKLSWGPFIAAKFLEAASGVVGLILLFALHPREYVPITAERGFLPLLGGAIFVAIIYLVLCGYVVASTLAFGLGKIALKSTFAMSIFLAAVFLTHATFIAIWTDYDTPSFLGFVVIMAVGSFLIHRYSFRKLA